MKLTKDEKKIKIFNCYIHKNIPKHTFQFVYNKGLIREIKINVQKTAEKREKVLVMTRTLNHY